MKRVLLLIAVLVPIPFCFAQSQTAAPSGPAMFRSYCAACHGREATGNGPVGKALKTAPPDLTQLKAKNGGKFPADKVHAAIEGNSVIAAHGNSEMPVWGEAFRPLSKDPGEVKTRIVTLTRYIESIQK